VCVESRTHAPQKLSHARNTHTRHTCICIYAHANIAHCICIATCVHAYASQSTTQALPQLVPRHVVLSVFVRQQVHMYSRAHTSNTRECTRCSHVVPGDGRTLTFALIAAEMSLRKMVFYLSKSELKNAETRNRPI